MIQPRESWCGGDWYGNGGGGEGIVQWVEREREEDGGSKGLTVLPKYLYIKNEMTKVSLFSFFYSAIYTMTPIHFVKKKKKKSGFSRWETY